MPVFLILELAQRAVSWRWCFEVNLSWNILICALTVLKCYFFFSFFFRFQLNSPMNLLKASRLVWRERTLVLARTSWTYPTCLSGSPCCMVWPSCTQWCKREGSLDHWDGIFHTSSTPPISTPVYSLYRTIWMTWTSKRWERLICLFSLILFIVNLFCCLEEIAMTSEKKIL